MLNTRTKELIAWEVKGRAGPWGSRGGGKGLVGEGCGREQNHGRHGSVGCVEKVGSWGVRVGQEERTITEMWWENKRLSRGSWISESLSRSG